MIPSKKSIQDNKLWLGAPLLFFPFKKYFSKIKPIEKNHNKKEDFIPKEMPLIRIDRLLGSVLGLCNRSGVQQWARANKVTVEGELLTGSMRQKVDPRTVLVDGRPLEHLGPLNVVMYKPRGFECSRARTEETELIYDLLPQPFYFRRPFLVPAGRLDKWASGLTILSQDGPYVHRLCSPKRRQGHPVRKYQIETIKPMADLAIAKLGSGKLTLRNEDTPCLPARVRRLNEAGTQIELTLHEGRYHQIRRMLAAVDNQALSIHRTQIGALRLDALDLGPGRWAVMTQAQIRESLVCEVVPRYKAPVDPQQRKQERALEYISALSRFYHSGDPFDKEDGAPPELDPEEPEDPKYILTRDDLMVTEEDLEEFEFSSEERQRMLHRSRII